MIVAARREGWIQVKKQARLKGISRAVEIESAIFELTDQIEIMEQSSYYTIDYSNN